MYSVLSQEWVPIYSVQIVHEKATVYDLVTDGPKNFIANGYLLLDK